MEWRVEFPRLGAIDIIRAFHFQQKQSGIAFLGGNFGGNSNNQKIKMLLLQWIPPHIRCPSRHHPPARYSLPSIFSALMAFCGQCKNLADILC